MGWARGLQAMFSPWTYVLSTSIKSLVFYKHLMGTDSLGKNLISMLKYLFVWTLFLSALGVLNHVLRKPLARFPLLGVLAVILFLLGLQSFQYTIPWLQLMKPLSLILLGATVVMIFKVWHIKPDSVDSRPDLVLATLTFFQPHSY